MCVGPEEPCERRGAMGIGLETLEDGEEDVDAERGVDEPEAGGDFDVEEVYEFVAFGFLRHGEGSGGIIGVVVELGWEMFGWWMWSL